MRKGFSKLPVLAAIAALFATFAACSDDNYSISKAEIDLDRTAVGQLSPSSSVTQFRLNTDADAEWTAAIEWDRSQYHQPAYVYPDSGVGSAVLKIAALDNLTHQVRKANLVIRFPKDESKNITVPITQNRNEATNDDEAKENSSGAMARGFGYSYNPWLGYCDSRCIQQRILKVEEMYEEDALIFDWSDFVDDTREESGASVDELARKLNTSAHASVTKGGFNMTVDAAFSSGQKKAASNEFAWLEMLVYSARQKMNGSPDRNYNKYMLDEAYDDINGKGWIDREGNVVTDYPATDAGFLKLVKDYGPYVVVGGRLGGRIRTTCVANTSKITSAYSVSASLEASYSGTFFADIDANASAKYQQASANSRNHNGFHFHADVRGGSHSDGSFEALESVLDKMSKARSGAGTEDDLVDDSETKVTIEDHSAEYELAGAEWKKGLTTRFGLSESDVINNVALVEFDDDNDLVPLYELVNKNMTVERSGVDGKARYEAFKTWFETVLVNNPEILTKQTDMSSYVTTVPTKIEPLVQMANAKNSESLIRDVYLSNGQHVARICSEFIPIINPTKRINVIYPMVNGKCRYNLGIFTGDEESYPAKVSWGWAEDPSTPVITSMPEYKKGVHNVAYLRGNHMTLEADPQFSDKDYATTTSKPYTLLLNDAGGKVEYPLVKINEYVYTRDLYLAQTYQNGAPQMSEKLYRQGKTPNAFSPYYRPMASHSDIAWFLVSNYTCNLHGWGGFAPQGWSVPYSSQFEKMLKDLSSIEGNKPDGTLGASFVKGGIYGFNFKPTGFIVVGYDSGKRDEAERVAIVNDDILYLGAIDDKDKTKLERSDSTYSKWGDLESMMSCPALAVDRSNGTVAMTYYKEQPPVHINSKQYDGNHYLPASIRSKGEWNNYANYGNPVGYLTRVYNNVVSNKKDWIGNHLCYPVIICQQVAK